MDYTQYVKPRTPAEHDAMGARIQASEIEARRIGDHAWKRNLDKLRARWIADMPSETKAHDRSSLHAALDAVLDSAMAKDAQDVNLMTQRLDAEIKPCAVKGYEGKWTCRITRGGAFVKSTIWPTREKAEECARKHHARIAALDAVLDHGRARDREPSMAEEKAYDMGAADAKKGSAQNPNPDWPSALKSAYVSGYHAGLGHGRARDAQSLTTPVEFVANYFDKGKWMGYMSGSSKADATMLARWLVDYEHHDSSNVENRAGTVVFTYRKK